MQQKLNSLKNIFLKRKTIIFFGLFVLIVLLIQSHLPQLNNLLPSSIALSDKGNIALASPACDPNACARYGTICCPGIESCVVWWEDENNCGRCGRRCAGGAECRLNVPGDYTKGAGCFCRPDWCGAYGAICCPGIEGCVNWMIDPNNCGGCGIKCGTGYKCSSGKCVDGTPPALNITNPQNGATVSGTVELRADAADPQSPVEWVKFAVKKRTALSSTTICQDYSFPYSCPWDTTGFADSDYYVYAWAKSQGGESIRSISVKVSKAPPGQCTEGCIACGLWRNTDCSTRAEGWCCGSPSPHCPCDGPKTGCGICEADCGADPACDGVKPGTSGCDNNCRKIVFPPDIKTPTIFTSCVGSISKATISWSGGDGSQGFWVDIDNDTNWANGFWNKKVSSRSTTAPDGFNPVFGATGSLIFQANKTYYVRIFDPKISKHSPTASFVAKICVEADCRSCTPWVNRGCGGAGCASTELGFTRDCPAGFGCQEWKCVPDVSCGACTNDCSPSGKKECTDNTHYKICDNYDPDPCLEWSSPVACPQGQTCFGGVCSVPSAPTLALDSLVPHKLSPIEVDRLTGNIPLPNRQFLPEQYRIRPKHPGHAGDGGRWVSCPDRCGTCWGAKGLKGSADGLPDGLAIAWVTCYSVEEGFSAKSSPCGGRMIPEQTVATDRNVFPCNARLTIPNFFPDALSKDTGCIAYHWVDVFKNTCRGWETGWYLIEYK